MLRQLTITHRTVYTYSCEVRPGPHRLLLRPRESRELRVLSYHLVVNPEARITWAQDVFGNAVATANFDGPCSRLSIESTTSLELDAEAWPIFDIAVSAMSYPFSYSQDDLINLGALATPQWSHRGDSVERWARGFVRDNPTDTLSLLKDLSAGISRQMSYMVREDEGTQLPTLTLELNSGSCRDLAALLVEAARILGFGGRLVSGYLHNPAETKAGSVGPGNTHAWCELYLPGAGWITFDPTNASLGNANLIPAAVGRDMKGVMPVSGSYRGARDALNDMSVSVQIESTSAA